MRSQRSSRMPSSKNIFKCGQLTLNIIHFGKDWQTLMITKEVICWEVQTECGTN